MNWEYSCGAVVFTRAEKQLRFVIVEGTSGSHSFPKGHMEGPETEQETARREIQEEIGLSLSFMPGFREAENYDVVKKPNTRKHVVYFLAEFGDESLTPRPGEIKQIHLLPYEEALLLLERESARRILTAARDFLLSLNLTA